MVEKPKLTDAIEKSKDFLYARMISGDATEDTYEKLGKYETIPKRRILASQNSRNL